MKYSFFILAILSAFCFSPLSLANVTVTASVDKNKASLEDEIYLTVTVNGTRKATEPSFPSIPAFRVVGSGSSSSIQIINGQIDIKKEYSFVLLPQEEGTHTIESISVFEGGKEYKSNPFTISIHKSGYQTPPPDPFLTPQGPPHKSDDDSTQTFSEETDLKDYWIVTAVNNKHPYVNEQILFKFQFFTSVNVGAATLTLPEYKEFWSEEVVPENKFYKNIQNSRYVVSEKIIALYPLQSGNLSIGETSLRVEVPERTRGSLFDDPFFSFGNVRTHPKYLRAKPIEIEVEPLPSPRPNDFTNLVGQYQMSVTMSEEEISYGDSVTMTIELSGNGNIKDAVLPKTLTFDDFKIYDDKPVVETIRKETGISGKKTFKKALVPTKEGDLAIPPLKLSFFNPQTAQYESLEAPTFALKVKSSQKESLHAAISNGGNPETTNPSLVVEDIATIHTDFKIEHGDDKKDSALELVVLLLILPPGSYFILCFLLWQRKKKEGNKEYYRCAHAYKVFLRQIKEIKGRSKNQGKEIQKLLDALREYVGDRLGLHGRALTVDEMEDKLEEKGIGSDLTGQLRYLIHQLERAHYGGGVDTLSLLDQIEGAKKLIRKIDRKVK